jgi:Uncharacterized protein conserved in bacteria
MKYMMMVNHEAKSEAGCRYDAGEPPDERLEAAMGELMGRMGAAGVLVEAGGLLPMAKGGEVRVAGGKLTVTDGPFVETKEVIGGYAILRAKSREEALKMGKDFMRMHLDILGPSYEGRLEIRQLFDPADFEEAQG